MSDERPPARPWFDLVTEKSAVKGWGIAELARRAKVGRPTIYGWRDNENKPQAGPVNAVADALGVPRERALRLAGVIGSAAPGAPSPGISDRLRDAIMNDPELTDEEKQNVLAAVRRQVAIERGWEQSAPAPSAARRRPAS